MIMRRMIADPVRFTRAFEHFLDEHARHFSIGGQVAADAYADRVIASYSGCPDANNDETWDWVFTTDLDILEATFPATEAEDEPPSSSKMTTLS